MNKVVAFIMSTKKNYEIKVRYLERKSTEREICNK